MRFKLVPKKIKEEDFWRNYFYRVSLIKQSVALHSMSNEEEAAAAAAAADVADDNLEAAETNPATEGEATLAKASETTAEDTAETATEEEEIPEWEKELQRELQEYEVCWVCSFVSLVGPPWKQQLYTINVFILIIL